MRIRVAAVIVALLAVAVLASVYATSRSEPACEPPRMLLDSHRNRLIDVVDNYLETSMLSSQPLYKPYKVNDLDDINWEILEVVSQAPGRVVLDVIVGERWTFFGPLKADSYRVTAVRDCRGGGWRVVSFVKPGVGGQVGPSSKS